MRRINELNRLNKDIKIRRKEISNPEWDFVGLTNRLQPLMRDFL